MKKIDPVRIKIIIEAIKRDNQKRFEAIWPYFKSQRDGKPKI